ncbi:MAG: YecA family protein [bacterium]|jgi:hypothetical protein|nr:SEC-C domain-containing protein [Betaproteobacteria bacterium]
MSSKPGRNDPCPCGSGRKFKLCHGRDSGPEAADDGTHEGAARRALDWLGNRHRKALERETTTLLYEDLWPEDGPHPEDVDPQLMHQILVNINEWMLAAGSIEIRKEMQPINAMVLADGGPPLNPAQREFIRQLGTRPLGLYYVTEVVAREGVKLVDALDPAVPPVFVHDVALSDSADPGLLLGCRILETGDRHMLSGAVYPFPELGAGHAIDGVREHMAHEDIPAEERMYEQGWAIMAIWLDHALMPFDPSALLDEGTGEPLVFVTDHYRVAGGDALKAALDGCADLQSDGDGGWVRLGAGADGAMRPVLHVRPGRVASRLEVFYRTEALADEGQPWFEALAGTSVKHLSRERADPLETLREGLEPDER